MREVISVQIGQFGNNLGERYLETISEEHGVGYDGRIAKTATPEQREKIPVHFQIGRTGRCVPRTVLVDSDPHCLDRIAATFSGGLCRPENFLAVGQDPASTWARGVLWAENLERVIDIVRQETEFCDCPQVGVWECVWVCVSLSRCACRAPSLPSRPPLLLLPRVLVW
eukprot:GHVU01111476.1.p1 GENE.GHVU01111476.1~~GHVU01111476.1.p1  ORF type:complete len:169 (-),score=15.00 GHVU01111476.1:152-658(-)